MKKVVPIVDIAIRVLKAVVFVIGRKKKSKAVNTINDVLEVGETLTESK